MKGLEKFKTQIKTEVEKVKDANKKKLIEAEANEIINHMTKVCDEQYDDLLNQPHKSFERMWKFVTDKARDYAINNCAMVRDDMVYGWIDEYVRRDDKEEVEKANKKKSTTKTTTKTTTQTTTKVEAKEDMEQVSIFDLM